MEHEFAPEKSKKTSKSAKSKREQPPVASRSRVASEFVEVMRMPDLTQLNSVQAEWVLNGLEATTTGPLTLVPRLNFNPVPVSRDQVIIQQAVLPGTSIESGNIVVEVEDQSTNETFLPVLANDMQLGDQIAALTGSIMGQSGSYLNGFVANTQGSGLKVACAPLGSVPIDNVIEIVVEIDPDLRSQPPHYTMPDFTNMPAQQAVDVLRSFMALAGEPSDLVTVEGDTAPFEPGVLVVSQSLPAGDTVWANYEVTLTVEHVGTASPAHLLNIEGLPLALGFAAHALTVQAAGLPATINILEAGGAPITPVAPLPRSVPKSQSSIVIEVQNPAK